ncbi:MAG: hypothetical protein NT113_07000 [Hyphomicrobiales bacterium]|nr:hypothetical protein [Hyphomicrobiales bacterium]
MARAGRKRKIGVAREKNGQVQRVYINPRQQVSEQPHRIQVPKEYRESQEAESEIGRLLCLKQVTRAQFEAGRQYLDLACQFRAVKGYPPLHIQAMDLSKVKGLGTETPQHIISSIITRYDRAFESICGQRAQKAVADCVVREERISQFDGLKYLRCGLDNLVSHFGIDPAMQITNRGK